MTVLHFLIYNFSQHCMVIELENKFTNVYLFLLVEMIEKKKQQQLY